MLRRLLIAVFGLSHLSVRAPALIGAVLYIGAACWLSRFIGRESGLELAAWCTTRSSDYLVAVCSSKQDRLILVSSCAGLSFCSNFSFAMVNSSLVLLTFIRSRAGNLRPQIRLPAACMIPGLAIALFFAATVVAQWRGTLFSCGATSLREIWASILSASLDEPNRYLTNPLLDTLLEMFGLLVFPALAATCLWRLLAISRGRNEPPDPDAIALIGAGKLLAGVMALTLPVHWLLFRTIRLLLPNERKQFTLCRSDF
jgi:hypothetical protein